MSGRRGIRIYCICVRGIRRAATCFYVLPYRLHSCEGCEYEVLPKLRWLLSRTRFFDGELHLCRQHMHDTCRYSSEQKDAAMQVLCETGHSDTILNPGGATFRRAWGSCNRSKPAHHRIQQP